MVLELAIDSAYYFLKRFKDDRAGFPPNILKKLHENVLEGLEYLHAHELIHTDIKPENILVCGEDKRLRALKNKMEQIKFKQVYETQIETFKKKFDLTDKKQKLKFRKGKRKILLEIVNELAKILKVDDIYDDFEYLNYTEEELLNCTFKIADLGTIHSYRQMTDEKRFPCIQTRYYRAPDVILKIPYDYSVDFWSMAAMYYELAEGKVLFDPHHTKTLTTDQVHLYQMLGWIGKINLNKIKKSKFIKYFNSDGTLNYMIDYNKKEINPENWDPTVLSFFNQTIRWL